MRKFALLAAVFIGGCTSINPSNKAAVIYNNAFARGRDEIMVVNILRASQFQPLQFSAFSNVTGPLKYGASISIPFTNIIAGGDDSISPTLGFTNRNPSVQLIPLGSQQFISGISRRLEPIRIYDLITQGWPQDIVLQLAIGGVVCPSGRIIANNGDDKKIDDVFAGALKESSFSLDKPSEKLLAELTMSQKDALTFVKDGVGDGRAVKIVDVRQGKNPQATLKLYELGKSNINGIKADQICARAEDIPSLNGEGGTGAIKAVLASKQESQVILRSVQGIFLYLGGLHRRNESERINGCDGDAGYGAEAIVKPLFLIRKACPGKATAQHTLVRTSFHDQNYYVPLPYQRTEGMGMLPDDRTTQVLALLTNLLDLETNDALLKGSGPLITVGGSNP
jgi:hypothetical protein